MRYTFGIQWQISSLRSLEDTWKLYPSPVLPCSMPKSLQRKVFVDLMMHLCGRGQENLRDLTIDSFSVERDGSGREYVKLAVDGLTKNHRDTDTQQEGGIMSATGKFNYTPFS